MPDINIVDPQIRKGESGTLSVLCLVDSADPSPVMACGMEYGCDYNHSFGRENFIYHLVRKAVGESPADVFGGMAAGTMKGIRLNLPKNADHLLDESDAETRTFGFIPINRLCGVIPEFGTEN
jgi:hypothetical protein